MKKSESIMSSAPPTPRLGGGRQRSSGGRGPGASCFFANTGTKTNASIGVNACDTNNNNNNNNSNPGRGERPGPPGTAPPER